MGPMAPSSTPDDVGRAGQVHVLQALDHVPFLRIHQLHLRAWAWGCRMGAAQSPLPGRGACEPLGQGTALEQPLRPGTALEQPLRQGTTLEQPLGPGTTLEHARGARSSKGQQHQTGQRCTPH